MTMTGQLTRSVFDRYDIVSSRDLRNAAALLNENTGLFFRGHLGKGTLTDRDNRADLSITHSPPTGRKLLTELVPRAGIEPARP